MMFLQNIRKLYRRLEQWLAQNHPLLWETQYSWALLAIILAYIVFSVFILRISVVPTNLGEPILGLSNTPTSLFRILSIIMGGGFTFWLIIQSRYNFWYVHGYPSRKNYGIIINAMVFLIFSLAFASVYFPVLKLSKKVTIEYLNVDETDDEEFMQTVKNSLDTLTIKVDRLDSLRTINYQIYNELRDDSITQMRWYQASLSFYSQNNYPAHLLNQVEVWKMVHSRDVLGAIRASYQYRDYLNYWPIFTFFFLPFTLHLLVLFYRFFGLKKLGRFCIYALLVFTLMFLLDEWNLTGKLTEGLERNLKDMWEFSARTALLVGLSAILIYLLNRKKAMDSYSLIWLSMLFPFAVWAIRYFIFALNYIGVASLFSDFKWNAIYLIAPITPVIMAIIGYFFIGAGYLKILYGQYLLPVKEN